MEDPEKLEREEDIPELEKNDTLAMWIAGVLTVGIPIALETYMHRSWDGFGNGGIGV